MMPQVYTIEHLTVHPVSYTTTGKDVYICSYHTFSETPETPLSNITILMDDFNNSPTMSLFPRFAP